jgi:hypothetical protein
VTTKIVYLSKEIGLKFQSEKPDNMALATYLLSMGS